MSHHHRRQNPAGQLHLRPECAHTAHHRTAQRTLIRYSLRHSINHPDVSHTRLIQTARRRKERGITLKQLNRQRHLLSRFILHRHEDRLQVRQKIIQLEAL